MPLFKKITAHKKSPKKVWDYFSMKLDGINIWEKIVPCLARCKLWGGKFFRSWLVFSENFTFGEFLSSFIQHAMLLTSTYL
jgi:hypothetical protein